MATGGQQRPFPDPTPSASQLSRRRSAPGGWKAGQRLSPRGVPPAAHSPDPPGIPLPTPGRSRDKWPCPGLGCGQAEPRAAPRPVPPPAGPAPPRRGAEGGRGGAPWVSLSLRHWPRSWRRRSGRYTGPGGWGGGASRELVPGRALSPSFAWPELGAPGGEGASARARAALLPLGRAASGLCGGRRGWPLPGLRRGLSPTPLRELPHGASRLLCPSLGPCPSPPGFPEPASPGKKPGGNLGVRGGAPVQPLWLPGRAARCGPGSGCGSGHESGWRWEFPRPGRWNGGNRGVV